MAIAGVNPAAFATSELGSMEDAITSITNNSMEPISLPSGTELFTDEQVREILIEFAMRWVPLNYGATEEQNFEFIGSLVEDFMKGDEA
ncbi:hypothetical protein SFC41_02590 [Weissella cibaria]|uniref:hypothetical protein n=1 Tax=Weissella cibaria TaxID=137591 RepID=UPI0039839FD4